jgi:hypothetical protein
MNTDGNLGLRWQAQRDTALKLAPLFIRHALRKRRRRCALPAQSKMDANAHYLSVFIRVHPWLN